jgi:hypothetical protein
MALSEVKGAGSTALATGSNARRTANAETSLFMVLNRPDLNARKSAPSLSLSANCL